MTDPKSKVAPSFDASVSRGMGREDSAAAFKQALHHTDKRQHRWGASIEDWHLFSDRLGLTSDLLPVVSNPNAVISPASALKGLGKTPSRYNSHRQVVGFSRWTEHISEPSDIETWSTERDYGICVQTRYARAFDIDIDDEAEALKVALVTTRTLGIEAANLPVRFRFNSGRLLIPVKFGGLAKKGIIKTHHGTIEFLADGQQFIAAGTHPSGERYQWTNLEELLDLRLSLLQ